MPRLLPSRSPLSPPQRRRPVAGDPGAGARVNVSEWVSRYTNSGIAPSLQSLILVLPHDYSQSLGNHRDPGVSALEFIGALHRLVNGLDRFHVHVLDHHGIHHVGDDDDMV